MGLATGSVPVRRPPKETRPELTALITATPADAELYSLRALEAEQQLDFTAAEADWKTYAEKSADKRRRGWRWRIIITGGWSRRRSSIRWRGGAARCAGFGETAAGCGAAAWKIFERLIKLMDEQRLDSFARRVISTRRGSALSAAGRDCIRTISGTRWIISGYDRGGRRSSRSTHGFS